MTDDSNTELVAPCGLYCGACPIYRAASDRELAERVARTLGRPVEDVRCLGCRGEKGNIKSLGDYLCPTYQCVERRGLRFCHECDDFPCLKLAPCADKAQILPHNSKVYNLVLLQRLGMEEWLQRGGQLWSQYFRGKKERGGDELQV